MTSPLAAQEPVNRYYKYINNYPREANPGWHENVQGITHDANHWYITQTFSLWKIPVGHDLAEDANDARGTRRTSLLFVQDLVRAGYDHFGDLTYHRGYLVIPMTGADPPILAVFRADDLSYVGRAPLVQQSGAGWAAVDPEGNVYSSDSTLDRLYRYTLQWDALPDTVNLEPHADSFEILTDSSNEPIELVHMQGGAFSPDGGMLYLVNGFMTGGTCGGADVSEAWMRQHAGIHVIDTSRWRRIRKSGNGAGLMNYEFHPGCCTCEEPEGLTVWDLDDGRAPNISGQLHVLLLDNDAPDDDDIYLKHYTSNLHVSCLNFSRGSGSLRNPFRSVEDAIAAAWDGAQIVIFGEPCTYPESFTVDKRVSFTTHNGPAEIGRGAPSQP